MSTLKVNTILSADTPTVNVTDGLNVTGVGTVANLTATTLTATTLTSTNIVNSTALSNRNLMVNGAMNVAQRGTTSTSSGYYTVDRFALVFSNTDESPTQSQHTLTSSDTGPYGEGFRKSFHIQNGNQTGGAGATDFIWFRYLFEAQRIANSGWNYTSSSSYVTLSFWVKSSVAQTFKGYLRSRDGTEQTYAFETGSLTANTWTKITKTIPGNSNLTFDDDVNQGLQLNILGFMGTDYTDSSVTEDAWAAYASGTRMKDNTSTWYTTNDATLEFTGLQLELGSVATPFEHRSFNDDLICCHRYYNKVFDMESQSGEKPASLGVYESGSVVTTIFNFPKMRTVPSLEITNGTNKFMIRCAGVSDHFDTMTLRYGTTTTAEITQSSGVSGTAGTSGFLRGADTDVFIAFDAEV